MRCSVHLEKIAVNLRHRNAYEAIDLGFAMMMAWRRDVMPTWASIYLAVALLINLLCFAKPILAAFIMWWLKPAFDRVILHILAGATFGATPSLRQTWRALPILWWNNSLFAALTHRRLDFARSFNLPVTQLERQFGKPASQRRAVLGREGRSAAFWLMIISLHFEFVIALSIYMFVSLFDPGTIGTVNPFAWIWNEPSNFRQYIANTVGTLTMIFLEPFYVAGGFALYLHTRTLLEGWDIEQAFRHMNLRVLSLTKRHPESSRETASTITRRNSAHTSIAAKASSMLVFAVLSGFLLNDIRAEPPSDDRCYAPTISAEKSDTAGDAPATDTTKADAPATPDTGAKKMAEDILDDPIFGETRDTWRIEYIGPTSDEKKRKPMKFEWLELFAKFLSYALRALAWIAGGLAVAALLYFLIKQLRGRDWQLFASRRKAPDMLFGLDVRPESLPDDVADAARAALANGDVRGALSLLYRGALIWLIQDGKIDIARGDTEGVCVTHVARQYGGRTAAKPEYFSTLVRTWQRAAYAHAPVPTETIEGLINHWSMHFKLGTVNPPAPSDHQSPHLNEATA